MRDRFICGLISVFTLLIPGTPASGQDLLEVSLSLRNVVDLAISQSSSVKYVQNQDVNYYWRWKNHQTRFRPQLTLSGDLPDFENQTKPIVQPDGSIIFSHVTQLETSAQLAISQPIPQLGATVYAASGIVRLQDFNNSTIGFSGYPVSVGITQPLFAYNWMKWTRMTEPLIYEEAQKRFIESIEEISYNATARFFNYLKIQTNYSLAESNLANSQDNLKIAEVKKGLGNISGNDFSRIQLSVFNAQKALNNARIDLKNADYELKKYIGLDQNQTIGTFIRSTAAIPNLFAARSCEGHALAWIFRTDFNAGWNAVRLVAFAVITHNRQERFFCVRESTHGFFLNNGSETS